MLLGSRGNFVPPSRRVMSFLGGVVWLAIQLSPISPAHAQESGPELDSPRGSQDAEAAAEGPLAREFEAARESFQPVTEEDLDRARDEVEEHAEAVERHVGKSTANGKRWLKYLRWDDLREALEGDGPPDARSLSATLERLNRDEGGLEQKPFRRFSDALRRYIDLLTVAALDDPASAYAQQLGALQSDLARYREEPTAQLELAIGGRLAFIAGVGQADDLVFVIRREFSRPNAFIEVSERLVNAAAGEPIDRTEPITDLILGTRIRGTAHTTGIVTVRTLPSENSARLELISRACSVSQNTGRNGPAVICSTGYTDFEARKVVDLSDEVFRAQRAVVDARTTSDIHSVNKAGGGIGSLLVSRFGMQQARQKQGQSNAIASDHAEVRIARRMNDDVAEELRDARRRYEEEYRRPLVRRGELPPYIRFSSTSDAVRVEATQANPTQLGAPAAPPPAPPGRDLVARLHATAVNNYTAAVLGGATVSESEPGQEAEFDVDLPDWMREAWEERKTEPAEVAEAGEGASDANPDDAESFEPYALTFRSGRPVTVAFREGQIDLTIHVARLVSGDDAFEGWDIRGTFDPELKNGGILLSRDGDLEVLPTGFDPQRGRLSSRQVAERSNLTKVLNERSAEGRGFPRTIEIERLEPSEDFERVGPLNLEEFSSDGGWLTLAWDRESR